MQKVEKGEAITAQKFNNIIDNIKVNNAILNNNQLVTRFFDNNNGNTLEQFDVTRIISEDYNTDPPKIKIEMGGGTYMHNGTLMTALDTELECVKDDYIMLNLDSAIISKGQTVSNSNLILGKIVELENKLLSYDAYTHNIASSQQLPFQVSKVAGEASEGQPTPYFLAVTGGYIYLDNQRYIYIPPKGYESESSKNVPWKENYFVKLNVYYNLDGTISYKYTMEESNGQALTVYEA